MTEREKVIKGLRCIAGDVIWCAHCPYSDVNGSGRGDRCKRDCIKDAIAILKVQEPVKPKKNDVELAGLRTWDWACPECNCILIYRANYCSCCGRPVKWE